MKSNKILAGVIGLFLLLSLVGCNNKDEYIELKEKTDASIEFLDSTLITLLNKLNNISFENYYVTTKKVELDANSISGSNASEDSKSSRREFW